MYCCLSIILFIRVIEINIFDFDKEIYNETMQVKIEHFIRGDLHLKSLEQLKQQLALDKQAVLQSLNS